MQPVFEDVRLGTILDKVEQGIRLDFEDGVLLYATDDILGLGYIANLVRERRHGNITYSNASFVPLEKK
jgi:aminodeoxyfutalosine synthase